MEKLHLTFSAWQQANSRFDPTSWDRSGIEPHGQDKHPEAVDVLIDSARDCLCWFAQNQEIGAAYWSDRLAASEAPILRRLSVYTVLARDELLADDKIKWLLTDSRLHDPPAHHEVFQLAKQAFPDASPERRKAFIDAVRAYRWPNEEEPERERLAAYYHLDWLHWLHSVARDCAQTKQAFDNLHATYPKWSPRDHPDLTHWTEGGGIVQPQSPWSTEDLLEKPAADWLPQLLSFQAPEVIGPDRPGLMLAITDAAKRNFTWGTELATSLADCNKWDVDLWDALIRAWTGMKLDEAGHRNILSRLQATELYPEHHRAIATMLRGLMTNGDSPDVYNLLPVANKIATVLWGVLDRDDPEADFGLGWLNRAINHPAGVLAS